MKFLKIIKKMMLGVGATIALLVIAIILFINTSPQFGGKITKEQQSTVL